MFQQLISARIEDRDLARRARLLNILAVSLAVAMTLFLIAVAVYGPALSNTLPIVLTLVVCVVAYGLNRASRVQAGVYAFLVGFALVITISMLLPGGAPETKMVAPYFYSVCVVAGGVMIGPSAGFGLATLNSVLLLGAISGAGGPNTFASSERLGSALSVVAAPVMLSYILATTS